MNPTPKRNAKHDAAPTVRCKSIRGGRVARSPSLSWVKMKRIIRHPKPTKRPMIRELFQAYVDPPHWNPRSRQMMAGTRIDVPMRSSSRIRFRKDLCELLDLRGILRTKAITKMEIAPIGRLDELYNQHILQVMVIMDRRT